MGFAFFVLAQEEMLDNLGAIYYFKDVVNLAVLQFAKDACCDQRAGEKPLEGSTNENKCLWPVIGIFSRHGFVSSQNISSVAPEYETAEQI